MRITGFVQDVFMREHATTGFPGRWWHFAAEDDRYADNEPFYIALKVHRLPLTLIYAGFTLS